MKSGTLHSREEELELAALLADVLQTMLADTHNHTEKVQVS